MAGDQADLVAEREPVGGGRDGEPAVLVGGALVGRGGLIADKRRARIEGERLQAGVDAGRRTRSSAAFRSGGTGSSNPASSSEESANYRFCCVGIDAKYARVSAAPDLGKLGLRGSTVGRRRLSRARASFETHAVPNVARRTLPDKPGRGV
jgi:hypothetical protein